jgi:hypothetical protein
LFGSSDAQSNGDAGRGAVGPDDAAPGWDAIDAALAPLYPGVEPHHWGTVVGWRAGGPDPLDGISAYAHDGPPPHWHFVSYGLSELYAKESEDTERSGWGIELTFRLARPPSSGAHDAPMWVFGLLQNLARHVFETRNVVYPGHHMDLFSAIHEGADTAIRAVLFVPDPQLPPITTPNGRVEFVQVFGLTLDEYDAVRAWDADLFRERFARDNPLLVTDLERPSLLADPTAAAEIAEATARDGSSMAGVYVDGLALEETDGSLMVTVGALAVPDLQIMLRGRLGHGRNAFLNAPGSELVLAPGETVEWHDHGEGEIGLQMPPAAAEAMASAIRQEAGEYRVSELARVAIVVTETVIRDQAGNEIDRLG